MGPQPHTEILTDGRVEPVTGLVWRWLRGNPRVALTLTAVALMALVGAGLTARRVLRDPGMSPLTVDGDAASSPMADPWQPGWDGRPRGPVTLAVTVGVRRPQNARKEALNVTGIAGPGIVSTESPPVPVMVPVLGAIQVPLRAAVDCSQVPPTVPGDAYRLQITTGGRARRESVVSAGKPGEGWARAVQMACATWAARRYLTVSTISARVHPTLPRADLTITIVNTGTREAIVDTPESAFPDVAVQGAFPLRVPQLSAVTAHVTVQLDRCDVVGSLVYSAVGSPTTSNRINLVATSGPAPEQRPWFAGAGEGTEPTGIVLAAPAGKALGAALSEACGDVGPVMSLVPPGGVRYDAATRDLAVTALVDVTPGKVSALSLQPDATQHRDRLTATPAWTTTPRSRPDAAGQVRITVHYRAPAAGPCQSVGATLLAAVATMRVPGATGERVVRYSLFLDMARDTQAVSRLCGAS